METDASGPEVGVVGTAITTPDIAVSGPDGEPIQVEPGSSSLLVQGVDGDLDAQSIGSVDVPVAGDHTLTVGEATAPVVGVGLVNLEEPDDGPSTRTTFLATFGGSAVLLLGVLIVVLRLR